MSSIQLKHRSARVLARLIAITAMTVAVGAQAQTTIYLADPELGVVGKYTDAAGTIYFEARSHGAPASVGTLSVRLLDAKGRTIAVAGSTMDDKWLVDRSLNPQEAATSQRVAHGLSNPSQLSTALAHPVFAAHRAAVATIGRDYSKSAAPLASQRLPLSKEVPASIRPSGPSVHASEWLHLGRSRYPILKRSV